MQAAVANSLKTLIDFDRNELNKKLFSQWGRSMHSVESNSATRIANDVIDKSRLEKENEL